MRAVVVHEAGGPEVLRLEDVPDPEPGEGEVLVRVEAVGINHVDLTLRAGAADTYPRILGYDAAGRREDTGERVLATGTPGTYAELVAAKKENIFAIPDSLDAASAAALGVPYKTAWWSLVDMAGLKEGDTLLVQGASTATGQASIDIGRSLGATVYATSRPEKLDKVDALGAEPLPYGDPKVRELEANVVFDPIGADTFADSVEALAREGTLVTPGAVSSPTVSFNPVDPGGEACPHPGSRLGAGESRDDGAAHLPRRGGKAQARDRPRAPARAGRRSTPRDRSA